VITGAILAANDELSVPLVFVAAVLGAVVGDNVSFLLGDRLGARLERRLFRGERAQRRLEWAREQLEVRGSVIIVACRFLPGGRTAVTFTAGALDYPWRRFIAADVLAGVLWAGLSTGIGWFGGRAYEESLVKPFAIALAAGVVIAIAGELFVRSTRKRDRTGR
jgi:membrane protein DedA with SNARE-associated domain